MLRLEGRYRFCHVLVQGKLFVTKENDLNEKERQEWRDLKKENPALSKDMKPKRKYNYYIMLYDIESKKEIQSKLIDHCSTLTSSISNNADLVNLLYLDRKFIVLNPSTLEIIFNTKIAGVGAILTSELTGRSTFLSPKPGILAEIKIDAVKEFPEVLEVDKQKLDAVTIYKLPGSGIDSKMFCFLLQNPTTGIICFEEGINVIDLIKNDVRKVSCFSITCCGIALSNVITLNFSY